MEISHSWCRDNNGVPVYDDEVKRYIAVRPAERQIQYHEMKYYNFIHFGINTFTDREWGDGREDESLFHPTALNTDQWCEVLKSSGSKGVILTAKHHDGFCLFDSKYTTHSVMYSPFGRDIVKMMSESCQKYGLKFGLYLSPWDRHEKTYGTPDYNDFFINQLTELCTNYGELFCLWFDGACGEGENGKKQVYDMDRYYEVIRKYQPNAVISICGPDVRWIGNEGGHVRKAEWSVLPWDEKTVDEVAENSQKNEDEAEKLTDAYDRCDEDLGSRDVLKNHKNLIWSPAEADVSVTYGWFWHDETYYKDNKNGSSRTPEDLAQIYFNTVGGNASLLMNVPVDTNGLISEREKTTLKKFTKIIADTFKEPIPYDLSLITTDGEEVIPGSSSFMLQNDEEAIKLTVEEPFQTIVLEEDILYSQRVECFEVYFDGKKQGDYTVIGSGKIIRLPEKVNAKEIVIVITQSRSNPIIKSIKLYK